ADEAAFLAYMNEGEDVLLRDILEAQGYLGLPHAVSASELDRVIAAGAMELWRGVPSATQAKDLMTGRRPFVGREGIYTSPGELGAGVAAQFALGLMGGRAGLDPDDYR